LCVTCDNVSNNDAMIDELAVDIPDFGGQVMHTRCFLHMVNLVAKLVICKFDVLKRKQDNSRDDEAELTAEESQLKEQLEELSKNIELKDYVTIAEITGDDSNVGDNTEGLVDAAVLLTSDEQEEL
ncbi:uncharacterized protein BJ212DRAFT_1293925, partial [Suillus subaureus]